MKDPHAHTHDLRGIAQAAEWHLENLTGPDVSIRALKRLIQLRIPELADSMERELVPEVINLQDLAMDVAEEMCPGRRVIIEVGSQRRDAFAPPIVIRRVLANLLMNAAKHTPKGTQIGVTIECLSGCACLYVWDDGPGIPEDVLACLFSAGCRGIESRGQGMGLHTCRRLLESCGGVIRLIEAPGTKIGVFLPAQNEEVEHVG